MRPGPGWLSDRSGHRKSFFFFGYGIPAATRAALALALS